MPRRILAGQLSEEEKLQAIEMERNVLFDLIRMIRFRAETKMTAPLGGGREGRRPKKILRDLFRSEAELIPEPENGVLRVRVPGGFRDSADASPAVLFEELNQAETIAPRRTCEWSSNCPNARTRRFSNGRQKLFSDVLTSET